MYLQSSSVSGATQEILCGIRPATKPIATITPVICGRQQLAITTAAAFGWRDFGKSYRARSQTMRYMFES